MFTSNWKRSIFDGFCQNDNPLKSKSFLSSEGGTFEISTTVSVLIVSLQLSSSGVASCGSFSLLFLYFLVTYFFTQRCFIPFTFLSSYSFVICWGEFLNFLMFFLNFCLSCLSQDFLQQARFLTMCKQPCVNNHLQHVSNHVVRRATI